MLKLVISVVALFAIVSTAFADQELKEVFARSLKLKFRGDKDAMCFENTGFVGKVGYNPYYLALARVADEKGSCQGMVAMASAIKTKVKFRPNKPKMDEDEVFARLEKAKNLHYQDCSKKVEIDGYANLHELCLDHEKSLRKHSLDYNLRIAENDILAYSWSFFNRSAVTTQKEVSDHLREHLISMAKDLKRGVYPLMLVRTHVTLVTAMQVEHDEDGNPRQITLEHYDPNDLMSTNDDFRYRRFTIDREGTFRGQLIWNITARPLHQLGCYLL